MTEVLSPQAVARIRELNDQLRTTLSPAHGRIMLTSTVAALPMEQRTKVLTAIQQFSAFDDANDPHGEHDMCFVEVGSVKYWAKTDYYDRDIRYLSDDPGDPTKTIRIMTIGEASEY